MASIFRTIRYNCAVAWALYLVLWLKVKSFAQPVCYILCTAEFFKTNNEAEAVNLPLYEKIKIISSLDNDEKNALLKLIDMAVSKKKLKDNLNELVNS